MTNCPNCGQDAATPLKTWPIPSRKPLREGEEPKLIGIYECPSCKARFRAAVEIHEPKETANIKDMVGRIKSIREELMQTLMNLREKIRTLETERSNLLGEIAELRKAAESRADALESEVNMLREELKSWKELLGSTIEE